jgi:hypothetical protein
MLLKRRDPKPHETHEKELPNTHVSLASDAQRWGDLPPRRPDAKPGTGD